MKRRGNELTRWGGGGILSQGEFISSHQESISNHQNVHFNMLQFYQLHLNKTDGIWEETWKHGKLGYAK